MGLLGSRLGDQFGAGKQIFRSEYRDVGVHQRNASRHVAFHQERGRYRSGEIGAFGEVRRRFT
jgi:hypothetical protein